MSETVTGPTDSTTTLSALLENVARSQQRPNWRLQHDLLVVASGEAELIFAGLSGPSVTTFNVRLSSNPAWMARHVSNHGIDAVPAIQIPVGGFDHLARFSEQHPGNLAAHWEMFPQMNHQLGADTLYRDWEAFTATQPEYSGDVVVQLAPTTTTVTVAVAFDSAIIDPQARVDDDQAAQLVEVARRAIDTFPHAAYGLVVMENIDQPRVRGVDLQFAAWAEEAPTPWASDIAQALLEGEISQAKAG
ncbi:hypothetical protein [Natronoglycomyces albus]|uniref:Uncharacterized protein n=1 Tax=Natronoglycomyces albus TaxID=2811108 RepID=A0A895XN37_9ACTN|nr:hypothetical protein [Natronoglycomyces albus]QSB04809.1 hypothetical protein JQS30_13705 [Natronoglycomyces albus]